MKVDSLTSTDGFVVVDLDDATTSVGVVRLAPKVLRDGAELLARSVTYSFALFGVAGHGGASAAINAKPESRDDAVAAFVDEIRPRTESGALVLAPALGVAADDLAPLGVKEPDAALTAEGALAAAEGTLARTGHEGTENTPAVREGRMLGGRTAAVVGSGPVADAAAAQLTAAGASLADGRFDATCDVLFVAGKAGVLDHATADVVQASLVVPLTPVPVTARAFAMLSRAGRVVVPDFLSVAAPLLAAHDADGGDAVQRIRDAPAELAEAGTGMWLAAVERAEANLATWTRESPFGRPLA
jgi:glutamate dehydrogenase/leucine dehydrogenase